MQKKRVFLLLILIATFLLVIGVGGEVKAYTLEATESNFTKWATNGFNDEVGDTLSGKTKDGIKWKATILEVDAWIEGKYGNGKVRITIEEIPEGIDSFEIPSFITLNKKWLAMSFDYNYDVTTVSFNAFNKCSNVERIIIPDSITTMDGGSFLGCDKLRYIEVSENNKTFKDNEEGMVLSKDGTKLVFYPNNKRETEYTIPSDIKTIGKYAFAGNNNLERVVFPSNVQEIENYAFYKTNISKIDIPNTVTKLGEGLFYGCEKLSEVNLPNNLIELPSGTFTQCVGLETVTLPETLTKINDVVFENCTNLKKITIPKNVTEIGNNAFNSCTNLKEVKFEENSNLKTINLRSFADCKSLKAIEIPEGTETIYKNTFNGCTELKSIVVPNSLTKLGYTDTENKQIQKYLPQILDKVIKEYTTEKGDLTEEEIKKLTEYINKLYDDTGIKDCNKDLVVYTPNNQTIIDMVKKDFAPAYIVYQKNSANVALTKYEDIKGTCTKLEILDYIYGLPVEKIENDMFKNNTKIERVVLPENLKEIGDRAFYNATSLKEIFIPKSVEKIGDKAFYGCDKLNRVIIRKGSAITSIADNAFVNCAEDLKIYHDGENEKVNNYAKNKIEVIKDNEGPNVKTSTKLSSHSSNDIIIKASDNLSGVYRYKINKIEKEIVKEGEKEVEKDKVLEGEWILIDDSFEKEGEYYVIKQSITENCRIEIIVEDAVGNVNEPSTIEITGIDEEAPEIGHIEIIGGNEKATIKTKVTDKGESKLSKYALSENPNINNIKEEEWKSLSGNEANINEEVTKNGKYYLFVLDGRGNKTNKAIEVTKIDKVSPFLSASDDTRDNKCTIKVKVKDKGDEGYSPIGLKDYAIYSEDEKNQEKEWKEFDKVEGKYPIEATIQETIECNGNWYVEVRDVYGNTAIEEVKVTGLEDVEAPKISFGDVTNKEVTVNIKDGFSGIKTADIDYAWSKDAEKAPTAGYIKVALVIEENTKKTSFKADASKLTGEYYLWIRINNLEDNEGNKNTEGTVKSDKYIFDNTKPTIATKSAGTIIGKNGDTKSYDITFSEDVEVVAGKELRIKNTDGTNVTASIKQKDPNNKKEWTIEIKIGEGNGTASITIPKDMFKDNAGNTLESDVVLENIITIDNNKPVPGGDISVEPKVINTTKTIKYEIEFGKKVNVDNTKIQEMKIENETQAKINSTVVPTINIDGTKCIIEVSVKPEDEVSGEAVLVLPAGIFVDEAGNKSEELKVSGLKIDTKKPVITEQNLVSEDKYVNKEQKVIYTIKTDKDTMLNENVTVQLKGEKITGEAKVVKGEDSKTWNIEISNITGDGEAQVVIPEGLFEDSLGNKIKETELTKVIKVDNTAPAISISELQLSESKESAKFKVTATDAGSSIDSYIITTNETLTVYDKWEAITAEGIEREVKANGIYYVFVKDKAGNIAKTQTKIETIEDKTAPVATITGPDKEYANKETEIKYTVTLSERATKDENIAPKIKEGEIQAEIKMEQKSNEVWEITVSKISGNGEATLVLPEGMFADDAKNKSIETEKTGLKVDNVAPAIERKTSVNQDKILVEITANEKIQNVDGWTLSEDGTKITKEFSEDYTGNVEIKDLAGNKNVGKIEVIFVKEVTLSNKTANYKKGDTVELEGKITPENATIKTLSWKSSDENIATVDENGKVTCKESGKVTITATAHNGVKGEIQLDIAKNNVVESIEITKQPNKKKYVEGDAFNPEGMEISLVYSEGNKEKTTDYACTPTTMTAETTEITVKYNKDENIKATVTGIKVYKKEEVKEITIPKDEYEEIKDIISDDIIDVKTDDSNATIILVPNENLTITVDNSVKEVYNVKEVFNASVYKVTIKNGSKTKQIPLTNKMISFDKNLLDETTYKFKTAAEGKEIEITVNYLGATTKFKIKVKSESESQDGIDFGDLELIEKDNTEYLRTDETLTADELIENLEDANSDDSLEMKIYDLDGKELKDLDSKITTNMKIKIKNGQEEKEYVLVVKGDLNADGKVNVLDIMKLLQHVAETQATNQRDESKILKGAYLLAADINKDGKTGTPDIVYLLNLVSDLMTK